ncbi:PD-(D/E)XK nuclease family protein [Ramlibacter sp. MAHUQ-53]|uniref:PD-(D/E)XK nuclease family protein n=1 Tax=unclassified Ramlibacter TaxID=2617605 RepID=UPI00362634AC
MNIFEIFCKGDGRVDEPNMSSVLAFLLNPDGSHGYARAFLGEFLEPCREAITRLDLWSDIRPRNRPQTMLEAIKAFDRVQVSLEERLPMRLGQSGAPDARMSRRDLDIVIRLYLPHDQLRLVVAIENKISDGAADPTQLWDEYQLLRNSVDEESLEQGSTVPILLVYLTPRPCRLSGAAVRASWERLRIPEGSVDQKMNYSWAASDEAHVPSITELARTMLENEHWGRINPASSHAGLLLRSLVMFIANDFSIGTEEFGRDADNAMAEVDLPAFWTRWPSGKARSQALAQRLFQAILHCLEEDALRIEGAGRRVGMRSTKTRITIYLPCREERAEAPGRFLEGPIARLRNDGRTTGTRLHLEFERRLQTPPESLFADLPRDVKAKLQIAVGERRTTYDLIIPSDLPTEYLGAIVRPALHEAVLSVLG